MNILGIETSCDETAAAVVRDGREVLSNVVYTQIPLHVPYGGVVPEIASRAHVEKISQVIGECLRPHSSCGLRSDSDIRAHSSCGLRSDLDIRAHSSCGLRSDSGIRGSDFKIDAVAVTYGPGLSPALIVGLNAAKGLAKALGVPLIGINHIEAHLHSPFLYDTGEESGLKTGDGRPEDVAPALGLAISGGNTMWVDMPEYGKYEVIGETLDDAAGEAFDKAAKLLGLGYPGGLKMDRIASAWMAEARSRSKVEADSGSLNLHCSTFNLQPSTSFIPFPKGRPRDGVTALAGLPAELCVSFSGLKTALLRYVQQHPELVESKDGARDFGGYEVTPEVARVVASYQEAIVQAVADRTRTALRRKRYRSFILGGGVSLNSRIRAVLSDVARDAGVSLLMAKPKYTGDNGAMIAGLAYYRRNHVEDAMTLDVNPCLEVGK